jgi:SAM-dependent methyltransferase
MTVLEVGGGYGGFARLFSRLHPRTTYVIVDLPDSLCYSAAFLGLNFPDSRHCLVTPEIADGMTPETLRQYDFVFVPVGLERPFMGFDIDLLVNTYSFGEIPNAVVERWFQAINSARNIRNLFLLNHFLNKLAYTYKPDGNAASLLLGPDWEIAAWELNPEYTEDPIETQLDLNYLQLVATRRDPRPLAERKREALDLVRFARGLPWYRTITIDLKREPGTPRALRRMPASRAGGLLRLQWDAARLMPCLETVETLALYLMSLTTDGHPFGETVYLKNRLKTLPTADEIAD